MPAIRIGYARCSTDKQDLTAQRQALLELGVPADPMGKTFFNILATFAEFEVDLLRLRTGEGMAIAKSKGKLRGKQPKLTTRQQIHGVQLHAAGEHNITELAELYTISRPTVYRVLERHRASRTSA
ncbi:recombinase family protein [Kribbella catacumbae]|uniref:recombinase family protein n=1 Tax=Kribbella catacumbae TaxID=460086 RepID=UPI00036ADC1E|nr:recombinase family protein [Kribbella catacumbae]